MEEESIFKGKVLAIHSYLILKKKYVLHLGRCWSSTRLCNKDLEGWTLRRAGWNFLLPSAQGNYDVVQLYGGSLFAQKCRDHRNWRLDRLQNSHNGFWDNRILHQTSSQFEPPPNLLRIHNPVFPRKFCHSSCKIDSFFLTHDHCRLIEDHLWSP